MLLNYDQVIICEALHIQTLENGIAGSERSLLLSFLSFCSAYS